MSIPPNGTRSFVFLGSALFAHMLAGCGATAIHSNEVVQDSVPSNIDATNTALSEVGRDDSGGQAKTVVVTLEDARASDSGSGLSDQDAETMPKDREMHDVRSSEPLSPPAEMDAPSYSFDVLAVSDGRAEADTLADSPSGTRIMVDEFCMAPGDPYHVPVRLEFSATRTTITGVRVENFKMKGGCNAMSMSFLGFPDPSHSGDTWRASAATVMRPGIYNGEMLEFDSYVFDMREKNDVSIDCISEDRVFSYMCASFSITLL